MHKIIMTDGTKTETILRVKSNVWDEDTPGVWTPDNLYDARRQAQSARLVPSVLAGLSARSQAMADLPFAIYGVKGDKALDDSDNYKNAVGWLPDPARFFSLTERALVCYGSAYWHKSAQGARTGTLKEVKYWRPDTVKPKLDASKGLVGFERNAGGTPKEFAVESVLHVWLIDSEVEIGAPLVWPLESALVAAEASGAITTWVRDYMRRGAIKAMLLSIDGVMPPPAEVERIESWFNRFMTGLRGLTWKVFNGNAIKPTIVGDGLEALRDLSVNADLRYEIHTALGTRHLLEDENYATASARERQFYTQTIVPDARLIQQALNDQVLHAAGYHLEFEPERLEVFQVDEAERATSLAALFGVLEKALPADKALTMAMSILGYDIDKETERLMQQGFAERQAEKEQVQQQLEQQPTEQPAEPVRALVDFDEWQRQIAQQPQLRPETVRALVELDKWQNKCEKAGKLVTWHAVDLPAEIVRQVKAGELTWDAAREQIRGKQVESDAVDALRYAVQALEERENARDD